MLHPCSKRDPFLVQRGGIRGHRILYYVGNPLPSPSTPTCRWRPIRRQAPSHSSNTWDYARRKYPKCLVSISNYLYLDNDSTNLIRIHLIHRHARENGLPWSDVTYFPILAFLQKILSSTRVTKYYVSEFAFRIIAKKVCRHIELH